MTLSIRNRSEIRTVKYLQSAQIVFIVLLLAGLSLAQSSGPANRQLPTLPLIGRNVKLPEKLPVTAEEYYQYADALWRRGAGQKTDPNVLNYFDKAIELKPDYVDAYSYRGFVKVRIGNANEGLVDLEHALELEPSRFGLHDTMADAKIALKDFRGALSEYNALIDGMEKQNKVIFGSLLDRGKLLYFLGDYGSAIRDFNRAVRGGFENARFYRGITSLTRGDKAGALVDFRALAASADSIVAPSVKKYPELYAEPKGYPYDQKPLATLKPKTATTGVVIGIDLGSAQSNTRFPTIDEQLVLDNWFDLNSKKTYVFLTVESESTVIYYVLARLLIDQDDRTGAEQTLTKALNYGFMANDSAAVWYLRGKLRLEAQKFEPAVRDLSWAISKRPNYGPAYLERGIALLLLGHDELAQKDFDQFIKISPNENKQLQSRIATAKALRAALNKAKAN